MLTEHEIVVSMVHPKQTKHFARMMLTVTKTDKVDAQLIALYGEKMQPSPYTSHSAPLLSFIMDLGLYANFGFILLVYLSVDYGIVWRLLSSNRVF